jgi:NifU-like protein involved in Fe-S cluster formation
MSDGESDSYRFTRKEDLGKENEQTNDDIFADHVVHPRGRDISITGGFSIIRKRPVCGDTVELSVSFNDYGCSLRGVASGCAVNRASTSLLCETMSGVSRSDCERIYYLFNEMMQAGSIDELDKSRFSELGDAIILLDLKRYPARIPCMMLAWNAFGECLFESLGSNE